MAIIEQLTAVEDCLHIFLTDTSQYLAISGGASIEDQKNFLIQFSEAENFSNMSTLFTIVNRIEDIARTIDENTTKNISIFFFHIESPIHFDEIRAIIDTKMIDSKIIFTSPEPIDDIRVTNYTLPAHIDFTEKTPLKTGIPSENGENRENAEIPEKQETENSEEKIEGKDHTTGGLFDNILFEKNGEKDPRENSEENTLENPQKITPDQDEGTAQHDILFSPESSDDTHSEDILAKIPENIPDADINSGVKNESQSGIGEISFREYTFASGHEIEVSKYLQGQGSISELFGFYEAYVEHGAYRENQNNLEHLETQFAEKRAIMAQELFEKEYSIFDEFLQTIALDIGHLYKEDQYAKLLGISRRKAGKYLDILKKHGILQEITPFCEDAEIELFRHKKLYFSDLSWYRMVLRDAYNRGTTRAAVAENFVFLELSRKLSETHSIHFWRKKSGTELTFVLHNELKNTLTPIDLVLKGSDMIPKSMKSFYDTYQDRIDYGMLLNSEKSSAIQYAGKSFLILPYPII